MQLYTSFRKLMVGSRVVLSLVALNGSVTTLAEGIAPQQRETSAWPPYDPMFGLNISDRGITENADVVVENTGRRLAQLMVPGAQSVEAMNNPIILLIACVPPVRSPVRTQKEAAEDARLTTAVTSRLMWSRHTNHLSTDVHTRLGKVTLRGIADSTEASDYADHLAMDTRGVLQVDNQLLVMATKAAIVESALKPTGTTVQDITDGWITTKVILTFMYSNTVDSTGVAVTVSSGVVTLSGEFIIGPERARAVELANGVRGVKSVHWREPAPLISQSSTRNPAYPD